MNVAVSDVKKIIAFLIEELAVNCYKNLAVRKPDMFSRHILCNNIFSKINSKLSIKTIQ